MIFLLPDDNENVISDRQQQLAKIFSSVFDSINYGLIDEACDVLNELHYAEVADFLDNASYKIYKKILPKLEIKPETLAWLSDSSKKNVIEAIGIERSANLIEYLGLEDSIQVIEDLDDDLQNSLITNLSNQRALQITEALKCSEDSVGRIFERNYIAFNQNWSANKAIEHFKSLKEIDHLHAAIVVDSKYKPVGTILLSALLKCKSNVLISAIMFDQPKIININTEISELVFFFKQYALTIAPVVNRSGKLIGSVSIDNMLYIIEEESEKDIMQMGGLIEQDTFYNSFDTIKRRFPWLLINLITACFTSIIINQFTSTITEIIALAAIMPIVASMGGNAGTQAMTVTVRALSNKDINHSNIYKVIYKEVLVSILNGTLLAAIGGILSYIILKNQGISLIFAVAMIINFIVAGFFGAFVPIILDRFDVDPATASGVFLTTITDSFGFLSFLGLAAIFLL